MMLGYFSQLALQGISRKKRSSVLSFLVLLISFTFTIVVMSIVGSISSTNEEYRLNTYGEWAFAMLPANGQESWAEHQDFVESIGKATCYGTMHTGHGDIGVGTVDAQFLQMGRIALEDGRLPSRDSEIAMEADALSALGTNYTLGQEITLYIDVPVTASAGIEQEKAVCYIAETFTLCGVIREFSNLWAIPAQNEQQLLVSAFITPAAAEQLTADAQASCDTGTITSYSQLFLGIAEENQDAAWSLFSGKSVSMRQNAFFRNTAAYPDSTQSESPDTLYIALMAITSLVAVFSVFFLQMKDSFHTYATCRSIGMTKKQLSMLLSIETLFLVVPAVLLGTALGAGLTFLSLRLLMYSGSAPIQVSIPMKPLIIAILLWVVCTVLCRLVLFFIASHAPLTGEFQIGGHTSKKLHRLTGFAISVIVVLFGASAFFTRMQCIAPMYRFQYWTLFPSYTVYSSSNGRNTVSERDKRLIEHVPGLGRVDGIGESPVYIAFPGLEETEVWLYSVDEEGWTETFDFGRDKEAFHNGDLVLLTLIDDGVSHPLPPDGVVELRFKSGDDCVLAKSTPVSTQIISTDIMNRGLAHVYEQYTVICSEQFLKDVLAQMEPGQHWDRYIAGDEFGYNRVYACADLNSGYLSTDITLAEFCSKNGLLLDNRRQEFLSRQQENLQTLIMLLSAGGCIAAISLLLMVNLMQLEAEREKRSYAILRAIGMSKRQLWLRILRQSFLRSLFAILFGALGYGVFAVLRQMQDGKDMAQAWPDVIYTFSYYGYTLPKLFIFGAICVFTPFVISFLTKIWGVKEGRERK